MQLVRPEADKPRRENVADRVYAELKNDIFDFRLLPGDRFSENELATRLNVSRTPIREALVRLQRDGYVDVLFRSGWQVKPFDFHYFEELYDVRIVLETAAVRRLCEQTGANPLFDELKAIWLVPEAERFTDGPTVSGLDERFHNQLVAATGNTEMTRIHEDLTERLRIIRRLDFTKTHRIDATYNEHAAILRAIVQRREDTAAHLLKTHIAVSKAEVQKITVHMLHQARAVAR
ncbi:MAG: GntR family transcriptional regulator [Natronospirillum sp.]